ncbi:MAG: TolC family protein, partial [Ekhidna sp.]|nr:TolC family protein [Ekhidna sp.]
MRKLLLLLGTVCLLQLNAQEQLSLSDAIQIGLLRNYSILIEKGNTEAAKNNNSWGEAGKWPTVTLNVNQNNSLTDNVRVAFPTATQGQTILNSLNPGINVNWVIFDGFRVKMSKKRLELLQAETQ